MHDSALKDARRFVDRYLAERPTLRIADVGSFDVNGSLRPLFERAGWTYTGLDAVAGPNVDQILSSDYAWPEIPDGAFDVVVTTQTLEHVRHPWRWLPEVVRICAPAGLVYVCSPNTWGYHEYPIDCWRVWPEGLRALFQESGLEPLEVYVSGSDTTGIGRRMDHSIVGANETSRITVLCVTCGRPTLRRALESLQRQTWGDRDEVLLVHDGPASASTLDLWQSSGLPGRMIELADGPHNDWGHTPRNRSLPWIADGYVVNLDDDDALSPFALDAVRGALRENLGAFFVFRLVFPDGRTPWFEPELREGNLGTAMFVHPAGIPLGTYTPRYGGDFDFVDSTVQRHPDRRVIWRPEAIYLIRPHDDWTNPRFQDVALQAGGSGREDCQAGWQTFFGRWFRGRRILDVGAGLGESKPRLAAGGNEVVTHDIGPDLPVDLSCPLNEIRATNYHVVTAFDVIEHVPETRLFLEDLWRLTETALVLTTPNLWVWGCRNPYHVREYSPPGLLDFVSSLPDVERIDPFASAHADGSHPTPLPPSLFLATQLPVLAVVVWKRSTTLCVKS